MGGWGYLGGDFGGVLPAVGLLRLEAINRCLKHALDGVDAAALGLGGDLQLELRNENAARVALNHLAVEIGRVRHLYMYCVCVSMNECMSK